MTEIQDLETKTIYSVELNKRTGEEHKPCPHCSKDRKKQRQPSFSWNHDKGKGYCHHCYKTFGTPAYHTYKEKPPDPVPALNNTKLSDKTLNYFRERGISTTTIKRNGITEGKRYIPQVGKERNCIWFNYFVQGEHVNTKFRDAEKNFTQVKGAPKYFYGLDDIEAVESVIITEGEFDKLSFEEAGFTNCISVPDGALQPNQNYSDEKLKFIENSYDYIKDAKYFYLATDTDPPGQSLREELARRLGMHKCYLVDFKEYKDANDVLKAGEDRKYLEQCLEDAKPYPIEGVKTFQDVKEGIVDLYENGLQSNVSTGYPKLDEHANFGQGWLTVLTGVPSHGKSSIMDQIMVLLAEKGYKFGVFSPEHDIRLHFQRLARILMGKQFFGGTDQMSRQDLDFAINFLSERIFSIRPNGEEKTLDKVLEVGKETIGRYGVHFILIDPWGSLQHTYESEHRFAKEALAKLNNFKIEYNAHVCIVAHPKKMQRKAGGVPEIPSAYDIAESSHFYNQTDQVLAIYYNQEEELTEIHIQKVKFEGILGKSGMVSFNHDKPTSRFIEVESGVYPGGVIPKVENEALPEEPPF